MNALLQPLDDAQLLQRVARRDREAFSQFYDRYAGILYSTILRALHHRAEAADVLQEVFLQIWDNAGSYDPALDKPFTWALTLTRHKTIDRLRSLRRRYQFVQDYTPDTDTSAGPLPSGLGLSEALGQEQAAALRTAVAQLPLEQRQAIEMAFLGGLSQNEIAEALQQPLGTIKARIRRGMLKLRDSLRATL